MAIQHRILHNLLVDKGYAPPLAGEDENHVIEVVTAKKVDLYGYFMYYHGLPNARVDMMYGDPGAIPDSIIVEYGIEKEDHEELAKYIDDITPFVEPPVDPAVLPVEQVADEVAAPADELDNLLSNITKKE